ncbi:MAG TPA: hypothetical protein VN580_04185 [Clostridia bacterium]|nr:hypothetical protein [Clostridia bacterium]
MEIDQLVALITKQVRERLETFEKRRKVLMLGSCEDGCMEELHGMFESSGFSLCDIEAYKREQDLDSYEFIIIPKSRFGEMLQKVKAEDGCPCEDSSRCGQGEDKASAEPEKSFRTDKRIISEQDIQKLVREGCREIRTGKRTVITPLALDTAKVWGISIVKE